MYPFITLGETKIYMTGVGILLAALTFLLVAAYRCRKYNLVYRRIFYRSPIAIIVMYVLGSYLDFMLQGNIIPTNGDELLGLITPYGYKFHFVGIAIGGVLSVRYFLKNIARIENRKLYIDVLFFALAAATIPLWLFLLLGDDVIGKWTSWRIGVQALHIDSELNKFNAVYPVGLFIAIRGILSYAGTLIVKHIQKINGVGFVGFAALFVGRSIIFLFQLYPRYGVISFGNYILDIKQYVCVLLALLSLYTYYQRRDQI